jgi:uncharacterized cofD-like protein
MKNIVTVGGGTGSYTVLSGLKHLPNVSLTALVSMSDDGGSTGVLRDELGVLPPGDVRQCLVALSEESDVMRKLMSYRFNEGTLRGHSFGNIFLAALEKVTGDFVEGVEVASEIMKVKGKVIPITRDKAELAISLENGKILDGENKIQEANLQDIGIKEVFYKNSVGINENAEEALLKADYVILGPGNYYCSVVPNLIVDGFTEAIGQSKAKIILPVNLTNKLGHTTHWKVSDYVNSVEKYLGKLVDYVLVNNEDPSPEQIERYKFEEGVGVLIEDDFKDIRIVRDALLSKVMLQPIKGDISPNTRGFIRHDSDKLASCIRKIIETGPIEELVVAPVEIKI